jgi:uncharacterized protein (DUF1501 family)
MRNKRTSEEQRELSRREFFRRAACAGVGMTATYCAIRDLRLINAAVAAESTTDYKALVCIFLNGGNDSNNLLVPTDSTSYQAYAAGRSQLAIPSASLLPLTLASSTDSHTYGVHPECGELQQRFNGGRAAFVANVGTLLYPITRAQYVAKPRIVPIPPQLFSHNDQVVQWMTSIPDQDSRAGWGGRVADLVNSMNSTASNGQSVSMSISLAGVNTFEVGNVVNEYNCSTNGPIGISDSAVSLNVPEINNVLTGFRSASTGTYTTGINDIPLQPATPTVPQANLYERAAAGATRRAMDNYVAVNAAIAPTADQTGNPFFKNPTNAAVDLFRFNYPRASATFPNSSLMNQLKMVARLIAGRKTLGHRRQVFFVSVGGYDLHDTQATKVNATTLDPTTGSHAKLFSELSQALGAFQTAIDQLRTSANAQLKLDAGDNVTAFTISDFGRTFPMNGTYGSDHGWGSHHIVTGDGVAGGRVYGTFPTLAVNTGDDTDTGRWIPKTSVDEYSATLAKWFGVAPSNLPTIFPNLNRFASPDLGFMTPAAAPGGMPAPVPLVLESGVAPVTSSTGTTTTTTRKPTKAPAKPTSVIRPASRK